MIIVHDTVRNKEIAFRTQKTDVNDKFSYNLYERWKTIELYYHSKFLNSSKDSLGRDKPFYNINKHRVYTAMTAIELDRANIEILSNDQDDFHKVAVVRSRLDHWMTKDTNYAVSLNERAKLYPKWGGLVVKVIGSGLNTQIQNVQPGNIVYINPVKPLSDGITLKYSFTIKELQDQRGKWREDELEQLQAYMVENKLTAIDVYEEHAYYPLKALKNKTSDDQEMQMHIIAYIKDDEEDEKGITLFEGVETDFRFEYLSWDETANMGWGYGIVEDLLEPQEWTNYAIKQQKDMFDMASKVIFRTKDRQFESENMISTVRSGQVLYSEDLTQVNNTPSALPSVSNLIQEWDMQASRVTSTFEANTGETMPSGTPFRQTALLNQEARKLFVFMQEKLALFEEMLIRKYVLKAIVADLNNSSDWMGSFTEDELDRIDADTKRYKGKEAVFQEGLRQLIEDTADPMLLEQAQEQIGLSQGNKRKIKFPKGYFDDVYDVKIVITSEQVNKAVMFENISTIIGQIAQNPAILENKVFSGLFFKIVEAAGVSPISIQNMEKNIETQKIAQPVQTLPTTPTPT